MPTPPVLLLIFNRPDLSAKVIERIRDARPRQLFVAADGARPDHPDEAELCAETRRAVEERIDWDCEVKRLYRDTNLGCKAAVSSALTWFFEHVDEGIIIEDDCVADPTFFPYCAELLERYRHDTRIALISGEDPVGNTKAAGPSYSFSIFPLIWGWATWSRTWRLWNGNLALRSELLSEEWLADLLGSKELAAYWIEAFNLAQAGKIQTWAFYLIAASWLNNTLCIQPARNLVTNIGFDGRGTNYTHASASQSNATEPCQFPLRHPSHVRRDFARDRQVGFARFGVISKTMTSAAPEFASIQESVVNLEPRLTARRIAKKLLGITGLLE